MDCIHNKAISQWINHTSESKATIEELYHLGNMLPVSMSHLGG